MAASGAVLEGVREPFDRRSNRFPYGGVPWIEFSRESGFLKFRQFHLEVAMKYGMYSIFDSKAAAFMQPFFSSANGMAVRAFSDLVQDAGHPVGKHPEDYSLFCVGGFDDVNGTVESWASGPRPVCSGLDCVKRLDVGAAAFAEIGRGNGSKPGSLPQGVE